MSMRRHRGPILALTAIAAVGLALLVTAALEDTVVYYRTPSEIRQSSTFIGQTVRLGGQVLPGSLRNDGADTEFELGDGRAQVRVTSTGALPDTFREGQGAVVEGVLGVDGEFRAKTVAVKHSNEYRAPASARPAS